jgi:hypothetical protein
MTWADDEAYASRDDVFNLALSAKAFVARATPFDAIDTATGVLRLKAHGLSDDDLVTIEVTSGGALPTGITAFTAYPVQNVAFDYIRLRNPSTLAPITSYVSGGSGWAVAVDLMRRLDMHRRASAARINECLTAHAPPLAEPYPVQVVEINARLAARRMLTTLQFDNAQYRLSADELRATAEQDEETLRRWLSGKPVHPRPDDETTVADNGARASAGRAPINWTTGTL